MKFRIVAAMLVIPAITRAELVVTGGCPECPKDLRFQSNRWTSNEQGGCTVGFAGCTYASLTRHTDGVDDETGKPERDQCTDTHIDVRKIGERFKINNIPIEYQTEEVEFSQCHMDIAHPRDNLPSEVNGAMDNCKGHRLGLNVVLNDKGEGTATLGCSNHCNQVRALTQVTSGDYTPKCNAATTTVTTVSSSTSTITTYTRDPKLSDLETKLQELAAKLAEGGLVDTEVLQQEVVLIQSALQDLQSTMQNAQDRIAVHDAMEARVNSQAADIALLKAQIAMMSSRPSLAAPTGVGCEPGTADCTPSVGTTNGGGDLALSAKDGTVSFESAACTTTDLCALSRQVESIVERLIDE